MARRNLIRFEELEKKSSRDRDDDFSESSSSTGLDELRKPDHYLGLDGTLVLSGAGLINILG